MNPVTRRLLAAVLGVLLLAGVLTLLSLSELFLPEMAQMVAVRDIDLYEPPPPPPPPPVTQERPDGAAAPDLGGAQVDIPVDLGTMALVINLTPGTIAQGSGFNGEVGVDFGNVALAELDVYPMPINNPPYPLPRDSRRRTDGASTIEMRLHIAIDENGNAVLIDILSSSHEQPAGLVQDFVESVKFTPPTVLGIPVRTEFIWPLGIAIP